jgi:hypothetical protein
MAKREIEVSRHTETSVSYGMPTMDGCPLYLGSLYTKEGGNKEGRSGEGL